MCGIAGWFSEHEKMTENADILGAMSETLCRRGPDEHGAYIDNKAALLHRRLAVIDPDNGKQPMSVKHGDAVITLVYNGEIYNAADLREELISKGYTFRDRSDTEVVLNSYLCWGEKCPEKLNGIFAFAVYDNEQQTIFLARDPIGVKPLFYFQYSGGLIFGSEIKTLLANPLVKPQIDEQGLTELLSDREELPAAVFSRTFTSYCPESADFIKTAGCKSANIFVSLLKNIHTGVSRLLSTSAICSQMLSNDSLSVMFRSARFCRADLTAV